MVRVAKHAFQSHHDIRQQRRRKDGYQTVNEVCRHIIEDRRMARSTSTEERRAKERARYRTMYPMGFKRRRNADQTAKQRVAQRRYDQKRQNDPARRLQKQVRMFLNGQRKAGAELVGCTREELHEHLLSTLSDDRTTSWKISFCKPPSEFDMNSDDDQRRCFHFSNLIAKPTATQCDDKD